ncbi:EmrB/QacA subfamily drug resistance transporter [Streptacidiphilus sp. MAP12-16]|uniref:MFS transporter n=1 Tax=Streptacidiphilus sp. MAP12-16 TaxID=3156300 RepID=UPI003518AE49
MAAQTAEAARTESPAGAMSHREIMEALSGLILGLFVAMLSSTIVTNALPRILNDLHGGESAYTWIIAGSLLSVTATTPLWGKLADLVSKKLLVQISLVIYIGASALAGLSQNTGELIACRVVQGIGVGGVAALAQVCMAAMISPRQRGRYSGYLGMAFALATVSGPLIGGAIVDTSWLGWRWCFYVCVPFALVAIVILQKTLHLPSVKRDVKVDYLGATVIAASVTLLLVWVTLAGHSYGWLSWQTAAMLGGSLVLGLLAIRVESRAAEPVIPLGLFRHRTVTLAMIASVMVGVGMYGATTFLSQYFQLARDKSPTMSGIYTMPMVLGLALASTVAGKLITRTGKWRIYLILGGAALAVGFASLGVLRADTPYWLIAIGMTIAGIGIGTVMQNLVLAVQNTVPVAELGAASSLVTFFRTMGGAIGVSALGALLGSRVSHYATQGLAAAHVPAAAASGLSGSSIPDLSLVPAPIRPLVESAFAHGIAEVFLVCAPFGLAAMVAVWLIKEVPLHDRSGAQRSAAPSPSSASTSPAAAARSAV